MPTLSNWQRVEGLFIDLGCRLKSWNWDNRTKSDDHKLLRSTGPGGQMMPRFQLMFSSQLSGIMREPFTEIILVGASISIFTTMKTRPQLTPVFDKAVELLRATANGGKKCKLFQCKKIFQARVHPLYIFLSPRHTYLPMQSATLICHSSKGSQPVHDNGHFEKHRLQMPWRQIFFVLSIAICWASLFVL